MARKQNSNSSRASQRQGRAAVGGREHLSLELFQGAQDSWSEIDGRTSHLLQKEHQARPVVCFKADALNFVPIAKAQGLCSAPRAVGLVPGRCRPHALSHAGASPGTHLSRA